MEAITNETQTLSTRDIILRYGLIGGGYSILVIVILYMIDNALIFGAYQYLAFFGVFLAGILGAIYKRKVNNGFISFGETVSASIGIFSIGEGIYTIFMVVLFWVIDPSLIAKMKNVSLERMDKMLSSRAIDKKIYDASVTNINNMDIKNILFIYLGGFFITVIIVLIIYLISSIFIKNESPFKNNAI